MLYITQLFLAAACVFASPIEPESLAPRGEDFVLQIEEALKPRIEIGKDAGCFPNVAVDNQGHLTPNGGSSCTYAPEDCTYARYFNNQDKKVFSGMSAIMYAWYFDGPKPYPPQWQVVVKWLQPMKTGNPPPLDNYQPVHIMTSTYTGYKDDRDPMHSKESQTIYRVSGGLSSLSPQNGLMDSSMVDNGLVSWETFTIQARDAVNNKDAFGGNSAPFSDAPAKNDTTKTQFQDHLKAAWEGIKQQ